MSCPRQALAGVLLLLVLAGWGSAETVQVDTLDIAGGGVLDIGGFRVQTLTDVLTARDYIVGERIVSSTAGEYNQGDVRIGCATVEISQTVWTVVDDAIVGDANMDGEVGLSDLSLLARNWQSGTYWGVGDVNWDQTVNLSDLSLLARNWGRSESDALAPALSTVPEPTTGLLLLTVGLPALLRRRRP